MVQVQTLQMLLYPGQFRQSAITHTPVGQQAGQRREDGQRLACTRGIGRQESRDKHLGRILLAYPLLELRNELAEMVESGRTIAVVGITHTCQRTSQRNGGDIKRTTQGGGHAIVHILHTLGTGIGTRGGEIDLQVADRLEYRLYLQILTGVDIGRGGYAIVLQQPVATEGLIDIAIAHQSESKIQSWCQQSISTVLTQHIAHIGHKARQQHRILGAIADVHATQHHEHTQGPLVALVGLLQSGDVVIEGDEIKRHIHVYLTVAGDGVTQTGAIL